MNSLEHVSSKSSSSSVYPGEFWEKHYEYGGVYCVLFEETYRKGSE